MKRDELGELLARRGGGAQFHPRSVVPTEAGERLLETPRPAFDDIEARLEALKALREKPAGSIRITTGQYAAHTRLWPVLAKFLPMYPDVQVELAIDQGSADQAGNTGTDRTGVASAPQAVDRSDPGHDADGANDRKCWRRGCTSGRSGSGRAQRCRGCDSGAGSSTARRGAGLLGRRSAPSRVSADHDLQTDLVMKLRSGAQERTRLFIPSR